MVKPCKEQKGFFYITLARTGEVPVSACLGAPRAATLYKAYKCTPEIQCMTYVRGGFKTHPPVDRLFRPVACGCHCLEHTTETARNRTEPQPVF